MKLAHVLSIFSLNLRAPFYTSTFTSKLLIAFSNVHTREKQYLVYLMYIMYANASITTLFYTRVSPYVVWYATQC